jgi:hypothetical protein
VGARRAARAARGCPPARRRIGPAAGPPEPRSYDGSQCQQLGRSW